MREIFKSGSVGGAPGNRCFYLEADGMGVRGLWIMPKKALANAYIVRYSVRNLAINRGVKCND